MVDIFADVPDSWKRKIVDAWKDMTELEKTHFINQMALALSIWGSDLEGTRMVIRILHRMMEDGSGNLADFGLYIGHLAQEKEFNRVDRVQRAHRIIQNYRIKNALPGEAGPGRV